MLTLHDAREMFLHRCDSMALSQKTINDHYMNTFKQLISYLESVDKPLTVDALTIDTLRAFLAWRTKHVSVCSALHDYRTLHCFFSFLESDEVISVNPMRKIAKPKDEDKPREVYSVDDVKKLLAACSGKNFVDLRDTAIIMLFVDSGIRASELTSLALDDVDVKSRVLTVRLGKGGKSREVPFGKATLKVLQKWIAKRGEQDSNALFIGAYADELKPRGVLSMIKRRGKEAGLSEKHCQLHAFRRYSAIESLRNGMSPFTLQRKLGHSTLEMTKHYCQLANSDLSREQDIASPGDRLISVSARAGKKMQR